MMRKSIRTIQNFRLKSMQTNRGVVMRKVGLFALSLFFFTVGCRTSFAQSPGSGPTADKLMEQYAQAWSKDNVEAVADMLAQNVVLIEESDVTRGREAVESWVSKHLMASDVLTIVPIRSGMSGDLAYQMGRWTLTYDNGTATGTHTFVFERSPKGVWRIVTMQIKNDLAD